jgi:putative flippase GtrA
VQSDKSPSKRPLIFLGVGVANTLLDFGFYTLLTSTVFKGGEQIAVTGLVSGTFALIIAFLTHGLITWRGRHIGPKTLLKFFMFTGFGMWAIRPLLLSIFIKLEDLYAWTERLLDDIGLPFSYDFVANTGAFGLMLVILLVYNYIVYERFVFKPARTEPKNHLES